MRIPLDKWANWWLGADTRITKMGGYPEENWLNRRLKSLYDMGQNLDILAEWATGLKDVNIFEIPGGENCSGFMASFFGCGNDAIGWEHLYPFKGLPHVHETADVAPGHFGMSEHFRRVDFDEDFKAGYVKLSMSHSDPGGGVMSLLMRLVGIFSMILAPLSLFRTLYKKMPDLFKDGIKITQRDRFKIPYPYWKATHVDLIWRIAEDRMICVGQEAFLKEYSQEIADLREGMRGDTPRYIVLAPTFLYGDK